MPTCFIVQPFHPAGYARLEAGGLTVKIATSDDMATVAREIGDAVAVITRNGGLNAAAMDAAPNLKVIGAHGSGTDSIDHVHANALGLPVVNVPSANAQSVAEHAIAFMLALAKQIIPADRAGRTGNFAFKYQAKLTELTGKTIAIVGFGEIGKRTAAMAKGAFNMRVIVHAPSTDATLLASFGYEKAESLDAMLPLADIVSLHLPLRPTTRKLIDAGRIALMKPGAMFINTARGGIVDEPALIAALEEGRLSGAGLDVFESDDMPPDHPLLQLPNVVLAPHIAASTEESLIRMADVVTGQVLDVLAGRRPPHLVTPDVWEKRRA